MTYALCNRAAIGRARFLFCTGFSLFFVNRAAMDWARFLVCTAFINSAAKGRAGFMFCTRFIIIISIFLVLLVTRSGPPLGHVDVSCQQLFPTFVWKKLLKCWHAENVTDIVLFIVSEIYTFLVLSIEALVLEEILNTLKKKLTGSAMACANLAAFVFATWLMRSLTLKVFFPRRYCLVQGQWTAISPFLGLVSTV